MKPRSGLIRKLSVRFALIVSATIMLVLVITSTVNFYTSRPERIKMMHMKLSSVTKICSDEAASMLTDSNISRDSFLNLFSDPSISAAEIKIKNFDSHQNVFFYVRNKSGSIVPAESVPPMNYFYKDGAFAVINCKIEAYVTVYFSDIKFREEEFDYMMKMIFSILLTGGVLLLSVAFTFNKLVIKPAEKINALVRDFSLGNMNVNIVYRKHDEIGQLASGFNFMALRIKKVFERLKTHNEELEEIVTERSKELMQAEKMASLGELVAGVSHEINTPIGICVTAVTHLNTLTKNVINDFNQSALTKSALSNYMLESAETAEIIYMNLSKASELVQSFKQIAADRITWDKRLFDLIEYISEVLISLRPKLKNLHHTIEFDTSKKMEIESYPGAFSQIITNLVMNSVIHAFPKGMTGTIVIDAVDIDEKLVLTVSDNGTGIAPENVDKVFEPFFTTKRGQGGSGLGLNIVYNLVTQTLSGKIYCYSVPGKGTSFIIKIPLANQTR